jgi:alpha-amylase
MTVSLIAWGRFFDASGGKITIPAPSTDPAFPWLWDWLAENAPTLGRAGFEEIQAPPDGKAQGGAGAGCDGYGVFDPRDMGSKDQQGSAPTRYGTLQSLRRAVARAHAAGMTWSRDVVLHQRIGANAGPGTYRYLGADGTSLNGRGPMNPGCFRGIPPADRPDDPVPNPFWDISFGDEIVYKECEPPGYTIQDALDCHNQAFRKLGADGGRIDDVKGTWAEMVHLFAVSNQMGKLRFYGEYIDSPQTLQWWAESGPIFGRVGVEDFPMQGALRSYCAGGAASALDGCGFAAINGPLAVCFVENPDTDTSGGQGIVSSKMLGYAYMLTVVNCWKVLVYGKDYLPSSVWPGAYGLQPLIDNLIWIRRNLAFGATQTRYIDTNAIVFERDGYPGLLIGLNNDAINGHAVTVQSNFGANVQLHDYTGHHYDIWTDADGRATFTIPSDYFGGGQSYLCFSRPGYSQAFVPKPMPVQQSFYGAWDLDLPPARNGTHTVGKVWVGSGEKIAARLVIEKSGWTAGSSLQVRVTSPRGENRGDMTIGIDDTASAVAEGFATETGWHDITLVGGGLPANGSNFELAVTYTADQSRSL